MSHYHPKKAQLNVTSGFYVRRIYFYPEPEGLTAPWGSNPPSFTITLNPAAADCRVISQRPWEYIHRRNSIETGFKMEGEEKPSLFELNLQRQHKQAIKQSLWHPLRTVSLAFPSCPDIQRHQPPESATQLIAHLFGQYQPPLSLLTPLTNLDLRGWR